MYAAGPAATLHAVAAAAERHGAWSQTALERPLTCATGLCQGCPVPVVGEDGVARTVRACVDGPVFRGDRVRWAELLAATGGATVSADRRPAVLRLANPVLVASGCGGTGRELAAYGALADLGGFVTRSITLNPRPGGPVPRIVETPSGPGQRGRAAEPRPRAPSSPPSCPGWPSRAPGSWSRSPAARWGSTPSWPGALGRSPGVSAIEVNLSSPDAAGHRGLRRPRAVPRRQRGRPPSAATCPAACPCSPSSAPTWSASSRPPARVLDAGAAAVVVGNALPAAMPDGRPGGLSGPAIRPLALRCVAEVRAGCPDAAGRRRRAASPAPTTPAAFLAAGAAAVQIGTALLHDPTTAARVVADLRGAP